MTRLSRWALAVVNGSARRSITKMEERERFESPCLCAIRLAGNGARQRGRRQIS